MADFTYSANLDIADRNLNTINQTQFGILQGTPNLNFQFTLTNNGESITGYTANTCRLFLVNYDRLDGLSTVYEIPSITIGTSGTKIIVTYGATDTILSINSVNVPDICKYSGKCGLIFLMKDANQVQMLTTEFNYNVIPNSAMHIINPPVIEDNTENTEDTEDTTQETNETI